MKKNAKSVTGGGILAFVIFAYFMIPAHLNAVELRTICNDTSICQINTAYPLITNHGIFTLKSIDDNYKSIYIQAIIPSFINYGEIITYDKDDQSKPGVFSFSIQDGKTITNLTNYGTISGGISFSTTNNETMTITNYGTMGGVSANSANVTIDNFGIFNLVNYSSNNNNNKKAHFHGSVTLTIKHHTMNIMQNANTFNTFDGNATDNSHIVLNDVTSVSFADKDSKIILDFGGDFELGKGYLLDKLVVDTNGTNKLQVDLSRLTTRSDIYNLTQDGNNFVVNLKPESSTIGSLYKSNVRAMNNFDLISNTMLFPYKYGTKRTANKRRVMRKVESSQSLESTNKSLESLESNAFFAYKNDNSTNRTRRRITTNRSTQNATQSTNQSTQSTNQSTTQTDKYYFLLTPFVTHNYFFQSGRYNLSGLEYGFITAFGGKITPNNYLGAHFMMSYGSLGDAKDKDFSITNLNLNAGLHYKLEMIWDMYLKARGDFYYFLNQAKTLFIPNAIKPNNLGFGVSVAYGKNFNFGDGGDLGVEVGIDYKGLQTTRITIDGVDKTTSETYQKSLYNLIYADLGLNYAKYFGGFGINVGVGIKGNVTANKLAKSKIQLSTFNRSVDMILDNDNFLGYANAGIGYLLNAKNFDMEFSLAYYGNFGDRIISNGGGFEWRVVW